MTELLTAEAKAWIGHDYGQRTFEIARDDIRKFALALGEANPIYFDREAARRQGYRDVVAPPNFYFALATMCSTLISRSKLGRDGILREEMPPLPLSRTMAGETDVRFLGDICAGDEITVSRRLVDIYEKSGKSGPLIFLVFDRRYTNQAGELVVHERNTRVVR